MGNHFNQAIILPASLSCFQKILMGHMFNQAIILTESLTILKANGVFHQNVVHLKNIKCHKLLIKFFQCISHFAIFQSLHFSKKMFNVTLQRWDDENSPNCMFSKYSLEIDNISFDISTLSAKDYDLKNLTLVDNANLPTCNIQCWCESCVDNEDETWVAIAIEKTTIGPKQDVSTIIHEIDYSDVEADEDEEQRKSEFTDAAPIDAISTYYSKLLDYRNEWGNSELFSKTVYLHGCYCKVICHCKRDWKISGITVIT
jgi:hypothetical protein